MIVITEVFRVFNGLIETYKYKITFLKLVESVLLLFMQFKFSKNTITY